MLGEGKKREKRTLPADLNAVTMLWSLMKPMEQSTSSGLLSSISFYSFGTSCPLFDPLSNSCVSQGDFGGRLPVCVPLLPVSSLGCGVLSTNQRHRSCYAGDNYSNSSI